MMLPRSILIIWTSGLICRLRGSFLPRTNTIIAAPHAVLHQDFEEAPPVPILDIGLHHIISGLVANGTEVPQQDASQLENKQSPTSGIDSTTEISSSQCSASNPCADGSCCNSLGQCGFTDFHCKTTASAKCVGDCEAAAECGRNSPDGRSRCPLNLCCSYSGYCGTTELHCTNNDPHQKQPCQQNYGSCRVVNAPSCGDAVHTTPTASKGRRVAYYQGGNVRYRQCNRISPSQIATAGLTHVNFAFASIDPVAFQIVPTDPNDAAMYKEFTSLRSTRLETWIAIGGFTFSDEGPTHTTWSDMVSTSANRAIFIKSSIDFMMKWGFQGVDIDWEFPAILERGGRKEDTWNLVLLVREMRAAYGSRYGISIALPNDFYYLQNFDPVAMEPWLSFINFMVYDLHGPWEENWLGAYIRPQTSIIDIERVASPLWFAGLSPPKINMGIAYYARGYTFSNRSCTSVGCPYSGPSIPGRCTQSPGVLSLEEVKEAIRITFDNQWIGYDDEETINMKTHWADQHCLGGTSIWSIDFNSGIGSSDSGGPKPTNTVGPLPLSNGNQCAGHASTTSQVPSQPPSFILKVSQDGTCGVRTKCQGSIFGNCCSLHGFCGSSDAYCGGGCQSTFGICKASEVGSNISLDGLCGKYAPNKTCQGSKFGDCCSKYGYCGSTQAYCAIANGCECRFGVCT